MRECPATGSVLKWAGSELQWVLTSIRCILDGNLKLEKSGMEENGVEYYQIVNVFLFWLRYVNLSIYWLVIQNKGLPW